MCTQLLFCTFSSQPLGKIFLAHAYPAIVVSQIIFKDVHMYFRENGAVTKICYTPRASMVNKGTKQMNHFHLIAITKYAIVLESRKWNEL